MVSISKKKLKTTLQILLIITSILLMSQIPAKIKTELKAIIGKYVK